MQNGKEPFGTGAGHPVPILKGSFLKGGNDKQYFDREEIF